MTCIGLGGVRSGSNQHSLGGVRFSSSWLGWCKVWFILVWVEKGAPCLGLAGIRCGSSWFV